MGTLIVLGDVTGYFSTAFSIVFVWCLVGQAGGIIPPPGLFGQFGPPMSPMSHAISFGSPPPFGLPSHGQLQQPQYVITLRSQRSPKTNQERCTLLLQVSSRAWILTTNAGGTATNPATPTEDSGKSSRVLRRASAGNTLRASTHVC